VQPRTAVGAPALLKDRHQLGLQPPVVHSPGALVFVQVVGIPARRDLQSVGHFRDGMFALHLLHQRKAPLGISADTLCLSIPKPLTAKSKKDQLTASYRKSLS